MSRTTQRPKMANTATADDVRSPIAPESRCVCGAKAVTILHEQVQDYASVDPSTGAEFTKVVKTRVQCSECLRQRIIRSFR